MKLEDAKRLTLFITEKDTEKRLELKTRKLPLPDGGEREFTCLTLTWKAFDFLVVCGAWDRVELTGLALERSQNPDVDISGRQPSRHGLDRPVSMVEINMLQDHRLDPVVMPSAFGPASLDDHLHNVVGILYARLQDGFGLLPST